MTGGSRAVIWWGAARVRSSAWPRQRREGPFVRSADTAASAHRRKTSTGVFITPCARLDTLAAEKEAPFISNFLFSSKDAHLLFQHLYQFYWHDCVGSCRCHKYCKHVIAGLDLRSNKSAQIFQTWHLLHPGRAHCSGRGAVRFSGQETSSLFQPRPAARSMSLFEGSHSADIYKTPKKSPSPSPPHNLPGVIPFKNDSALYAGLTCTRETRSKTNSGHLNINQPAHCFAGGATAHFCLWSSKTWTRQEKWNCHFDIM